MFKGKKTVAILLSAVMIASLGSYGFAVNDKDKVDKSDKVTAQMELKEVKQMYDKDKDKLFESLSDKISAAKEEEDLPVIVVFKDKFDDTKKKKVKDLVGDYEAKHEFKNIPATAMKLNKKQISQLSELDIIDHIEYDEPVKAFNDTANYWFGTEKARTDFGVDGNTDGSLSSYSKDDVVVAVIDTGIDDDHVDLDGGKVIGWKDYVNGKTSAYDDNGHGTHVAGIVAGEGDGNSAYEGVAKGAALVGVKVLDGNGDGYTSDVTAAIDWCVSNKDTYGIEVINMSLGSSGSSDGTDSTSLAVNEAVANGITVVVAAGNEGPSSYTIGSPGAAEDAITVANMIDVGEEGFGLAYLSSRGPTADNRIKPDIGAPGTNITAPQTNSTNGYVTYSGTSMATPFTAGTIALMLEADPSLTPSQIKNILISTAEDWGTNGQDTEYGYGRLDGYAAVESAGGFNGTNIDVPDHMYGSEDLTARRNSDIWEFTVNSTSDPIAITLIMPDWSNSRNPDFDVYLYDASGTKVASSTGTGRQENINYTPTSTGTYKIEVYSYYRTGDYYFDLSADGSGLTLTQDQ